MHTRHKLQLVRKEHIDDRIYMDKLQLVHKGPNAFAHLLQHFRSVSGTNGAIFQKRF